MELPYEDASWQNDVDACADSILELGIKAARETNAKRVLSVLIDAIDEANLRLTEELEDRQGDLIELGMTADELDQVDEAIEDGNWYLVETTCGIEYLPQDMVDSVVQHPIAKLGGAKESDYEDWNDAIARPLRKYLNGKKAVALTLLSGFGVDSAGKWRVFEDEEEAREFVRQQQAG